MMVLYAIICVPETKGVPLESISLLFEGRILRGAIMDIFPSRTRAKHLRETTNVNHDGDDKVVVSHIERTKAASDGQPGSSSTSREESVV